MCDQNTIDFFFLKYGHKNPFLSQVTNPFFKFLNQLLRVLGDSQQMINKCEI